MRPLASASLTALLFAASSPLAICGEEPAAAPAAFGAITVGEEVVLMAPGGPGGTRRRKAAVAFGKDNYLVAWQEGWHGEGGSSRIFVLRVGPYGKALDAKPVELAPAKTGVQEYPRVAFFGGHYLVVWQDFRNGKDTDVLGARVSAEGKVLDEQPIVIAGGARTQAMPDVAAADKGFMVVWHGFQGEEAAAKVFSRRVAADGAAGGEASVVAAGSSPRIAWNGKEHLVVHFKFERSMGWQRLDAAGKPLPAQPVRGAPGTCETPWQYSIGGIPGGKGWLVAYHEGAPNYWARTKGTQAVISITADGGKGAQADMDTSAGRKAHASPIGAAHSPDIWPWGASAVVPDGEGCVAVWQRFHLGDATGMAMINGDIRASRLDGWKPLEGNEGVAVAEGLASELDPVLAGDGKGRLLCVYEKDESGRSSIVARTLQTK